MYHKILYLRSVLLDTELSLKLLADRCQQRDKMLDEIVKAQDMSAEMLLDLESGGDASAFLTLEEMEYPRHKAGE
jgi:hypothetical protein